MTAVACLNPKSSTISKKFYQISDLKGLERGSRREKVEPKQLKGKIGSR
jgi:hypothetical protein